MLLEKVKKFIQKPPSSETEQRIIGNLIPACSGLVMAGVTTLLREAYTGKIIQIESLASILHILHQRAPELFEWLIWTGPDIGSLMLCIGLLVFVLDIQRELLEVSTPSVKQIDYILETIGIVFVSFLSTTYFMSQEFAQVVVKNDPNIVFTFKDLFGYLGAGVTTMLTVLTMDIKSRLRSLEKDEQQY